MYENMKWEDVYGLWRTGCYGFPNELTAPVSAETIFVRYENKDCCIYGYDWLENSEAEMRKELIKENPEGFLYVEKPTNKGTIQTAEMLIEAQDEEELAAIWIAATAKELYELRMGRDIGRYAYMLYIAAYPFLESRYFMWHHAMKRLVPYLMIPFSILRDFTCKNAESVMGLIQMNTLLVKSSCSILRYTSLKEGEAPKFRNIVRRKMAEK